ncbi:MAG: hypothetical protein ACPL3P_07830 [Anaerolineales bacterium]
MTQIRQHLPTGQNNLADSALSLTQIAQEQIKEGVGELITLTATLSAATTENISASSTPEPNLNAQPIATNNPASSMVPPGLLKKTQTNNQGASSPVPPQLKATKTPRPTITARPVNTHKPPTNTPKQKPTKQK